MTDRISRFRVARLCVFPPMTHGGQARYAATAATIRQGVPHAQILVDGTLPNCPAFPTTEEVLEMFDSAVRAHMLSR